MTAVAAPVRERGILMSAPMVIPTLDGRKTMTRRTRGLDAYNEQPDEWAVERTGLSSDGLWRFIHRGERAAGIVRCPYGVRSDRVWVRETFVVESNRDTGNPHYVPPFTDGRPVRRQHDEDWGDWWEQPHYAATDPKPDLVNDNDQLLGWKPSIHMPRWASRLTLEITEVRVERVQSITANDCIAEGIPSRGIDRDGPCIASALVYIEDYKNLWDSLNAKRGFGWDINPWVWVLAFKKVTP